ncbi:MAG: hypothetical protein JNK16_00205 [Phycisphaerales bacterium]|nr:hypothetical protein [Phycisphaerales bacterium]
MIEPNSRLRALAGLLAEMSVEIITLTHAGTRRELHARTTDLPKELEAIARDGGEVEIPQLGAAIRFSGSNFRCECADPAISLAILKALAHG